MSTLKKLAVLSILVVTLVAFSMPAMAANTPMAASSGNNVAPANAVMPAATDTAAPVAAPMDKTTMPMAAPPVDAGAAGVVPPVDAGAAGVVPPVDAGAAGVAPPVDAGAAGAPATDAAAMLSGIPNAVLPGNLVAGTPIGGAAVGPFGGVGFPWNFGSCGFGLGGYPFNWGLGGGWSGCGLGWNQFTPCFGGGCGGFFSPCFLGGCGMLQALPFITGCGLGGVPGVGWELAPWAFGLGGCQKAAPLYFGAHGFGFPFTIGNIGWSLVPGCC